MNTKTHRDYGRQLILSALATGLLYAPLADYAYAAGTPLADIPIASKVAAKPNIVYTMDDSGSMQFGYLPDWAVAAAASAAVTKITRVGAVATATVPANAKLKGQTTHVLIWGANQPEYDGSFLVTFDNVTGTTFTFNVAGAPASPATGAITYSWSSAYCRGGNNVATCSTGAINTFTSPPYYAAEFNALAYNPDVNYTPPVKANGLPLTHIIGTDTDVNGNQINFAKVQPDPFVNPGAAYAVLTNKVAVPLYCNTDWPLTAGVNLAMSDIGDLNGEYAAGTGGWCRINGTPYDASVASGAPQVPGTYSYPYQLSAGANGTQYFYRQLSNKVLWCDATSPAWPRNNTVITGCNGGTTVLGGNQKQTCNQNGKTCNPTPGLRNWTAPVLPEVCAANVNYCLPNQGGSDGNSIGLGSPPECTACVCKADYQPAGGRCSITNAVCNGPYGISGGDLAECPDQPGTITGCTGGTPIYKIATALCQGTNLPANQSGLLWDPVANAPTATTLLQDSNAQGYVCRHNNQVYAVTGVPAAGTPFTYSRTNAGDVYPMYAGAPYNQKGQFTTQVTASCPTVGTTVSIPRHYYTIDVVQYCNNIDTTVNGQWRGFGLGVVATDCTPANDLEVHRNIQFCPAAGCPETATSGAFHRINLISDGRVFNYIDQLTGAPASRTYAQEIINYANWYAYYRLRSLAAKTTTTLAFSLLDDSYRVGFHTIGAEQPPYGKTPPPPTPVPSWVDVNDFNAAQKTTWWAALFAVPTVTTNKTPTLDAMIRIGALFEFGNNSLPASVASPVVNPLPAAADPLAKDGSGNTISCQSNFHILFTDGNTDQVALPPLAGDYDETISAALPPDDPVDLTKTLPNFRPGAPTWPNFPNPFRQGPVKVGNTLADIGMYYWARDLRAAKNDVPNWPGNLYDLDPTKDVAWWQHVQFSAISFGANGTLDASDQVTTFANLKSGANVWPDLTTPQLPPLPASNPGAVAVDDLWHATANSRGRFVYARSPLEVQYGLAAILAGISNSRKSRSGAAFSGTVLNATNDIIYEPTIEIGWAGDLLKVEIDPLTGNEKKTWWNASSVLWDKGTNTGQIAPAFSGDEPWMDETKRRIVTWSGGTQAAFRATPSGSMGTVLSNAQLNTLSLNATTQKKMVAYLRGGNTVNTPIGPKNGFVIEGTGIGQYRERFGPLGDISNAQPLVVSKPHSPPDFSDTHDPGYSAYVSTWNPTPKVVGSGRPDRIVAAANDGMVHVFDSNDGHEVFAYVPSELLRTAVDSSGKPTGLVALTFQDGGVPIYKHHFYVDSSPRESDVDLNSAGVKGGGPDWRTIVVGGLGKGGASYYALDLTDPDAAKESDAAAKLLWEYHDPDWTYTYGHPVIAKTYAFGWTVIVTSGYNNVSGEGRVYFLDPATGKPFASKPFLTTGAVSCTGPTGATETSGLAQINGFTKDYHNQFVEQIYGGDLCGNFWRFDVHDPNPANWKVDKFAVLVDPAGNPQPVTSAPQIEIDIANGVDRYVFIGTGRLLDITDLTNPTPVQQQTMYAFRDGSNNTPMGAASLPVDTVRGTTALKPVDAVTGSGIAGGAPAGWYHDLPVGATSERVVVDVEADVNVVSYVGTQVTNDPCTIALPANVYAREFASSRSLVFDGAGNPWYFSQSGGVGLQIVGLEVLDASGNVIGVQLGGLLSHEVPGTGPVPFQNPTASTRNRFSWRLLQGQ